MLAAISSKYLEDIILLAVALILVEMPTFNLIYRLFMGDVSFSLAGF